jgi:tRNA wybutosine-synthesizing protein 2
MMALRVPRERVEEARLVLSENGLLDKHHRIEHVGNNVEIPLLATPNGKMYEELTGLGGEVIDEREYAWRETFKEPFKDILKRIQIPEDKKPLLPAKWEQLGHVLIMKINGELIDWLDEISNAYSEVLGAQTILRDVGGIEGEYREPVLELIKGTTTETTHVENGIKYKLDAARLMFSSGNVDERIRMASVCKDGEVVVDMFAGIGYFALPMAVHSDPRKIIAYEINTLAYDYLRQNITLNEIENIIEPHLSDCSDARENVADRVVMGYIGTTHEFLPKAVRILRGKGVIHYHETCPDRLMSDRPLKRIKGAAENEGKEAEILNIRTIKSYAPGVRHVVVDARVG